MSNGDMSNAFRFHQDMDGPHLAVFQLAETVFSAYHIIPKGTMVKLCGTVWKSNMELFGEQAIMEANLPDTHATVMNVIHGVSTKKLVFGYHMSERR